MKKAPLELFVGPCVIESEEFVLDMVSRIQEELAPFQGKINLTFKASFDKANRSSFNSFRGPGLEKGVEILGRVKEKSKLPVLTDYHTPDQAMKVASVVDVLQVPAFLCRQTDMIHAGAEACKKYGRILKIKKGQFLSPEETGNIVDKAKVLLPLNQIYLTERGSSFGYNNLVVDMGSFQTMKSFGVKAIHDATHCVQRPGGLGTSTGGKREQIEILARAAIAAGADGIFMECHTNPDKALSDPTTSLDIKKIRPLVDMLLRVYEVVP